MYRTTSGHAPLTGVPDHWDAAPLRNIAQYGHFSPRSAARNTVFFPRYPVTLAAAHLILRRWHVPYRRPLVAAMAWSTVW